MKLSIPLYIQPQPQENGTLLYEARPVFFPQPAASDRFLHRALERLSQSLVQTVKNWHDERHDLDIARLAYCPEFKEHRLPLPLTLRKHTASLAVTVLEFSVAGRRMALAPRWPDMWFDLADSDTVAVRAQEVFTAHWRHAERNRPVYFAREYPLLASLPAGSLHILDLQLPPRRRKPSAKSRFLFFDDSAGQMDGNDELLKVARNLNRLYPDDLDHALHREPQIAELLRRLRHDQPRRPIALIGPSKVGKTAVIHEMLRRKIQERPPSLPNYQECLWHLSPARLISGMSYVGQWEGRLLAILKTAHRHDLTLYFDDMPGLFFAGQHSQSTLCAANVLKPHIERAQCRVLGEFTPETWRIFQEADRGMADLFHVIRLEEPARPIVLKTLISAARDLEQRHACAFAPQVIPTLHELTHHYQRHAAFPGKAAALLKSLAVKYTQREISRDDALSHFHQTSGLLPSLLDNTARLARQDVHDALAAQIHGQSAAVHAMVDTVLTAKTRLNEPGRPLAAMLFLGPTGVGKTQCAKALAAYLFGDAARMVRLDMNEFPGHDAVSRIIGGPGLPEGVLTSQVRRQPFCVVLLDEIEKAHPCVFDVLLQVLGEGRLTDALGRTVDFGNAIIILTSNLGSAQAQSSFGFASPGNEAHDQRRRQAYLQAAQAFFRPEFFNRFDKVIPFDPLTRQETAAIARTLVNQILAREGLRQRRCVMQVDQQAIENLVDLGYHPQLGARALRRVVERELGAAAAEELARLQPDSPILVHIGARGRSIATSISPFSPAAQMPLPQDTVDLSRRKHLFGQALLALSRMAQDLAVLAPKTAITAKAVTPAQEAYFGLSAVISQLKEQITADLVKRQGPPMRTFHAPMPDSGFLRVADTAPLFASPAPWPVLLRMPGTVPIAQDQAHRLSRLLDNLAFLDLLVHGALDTHSQNILFLHQVHGTSSAAAQLPPQNLFPALAQSLPGYHVLPLTPPDAQIVAWHISGPGAAELAAMETGSTFATDHTGATCLLQAQAFTLTPRQDAAAALARLLRKSPVIPIAPVLRLVTHDTVTDLRTGLIQRPAAYNLRPLLAALLPLPLELEESPS